MNKTLIIDAGHGTDTAGKYSPKFEDGTRFREWEFNKATAEHLETLALLQGFKVFHTKRGERTDTSLATRCSRAAEDFYAHGGVLVSVHANAFNATGEEWTTANGIETFHHPKDAASKPLAQAVQDELIEATGLRNRGVKTSDFAILRDVPVKLPCVLAECGFYTNRNEVKLLQSDEYRKKCAEAILRGVCKFMGIAYRENNGQDVSNEPSEDSVPRSVYDSLQAKYDGLQEKVNRFIKEVEGV